MLLLTDESPNPEERVPGFRSPQSLGGTSVTMQLYVNDVDAAYNPAIDAGASPMMPPEDCFWGTGFAWRKILSAIPGRSRPFKKSLPQRRWVTE